MGSGSGTETGEADYRLIVDVAYDAQGRPFERMMIRASMPRGARFPLYTTGSGEFTVVPELELSSGDGETEQERLMTAPYRALDLAEARARIQARISALQAALNQPILRVVHDEIQEVEP